MVRQSILFAVLALIVISSKHILIFNEELLVLSCFVLFVLFCSKTMSESVQSSFEDRQKQISQELQAHLMLQEQYAQELVREHTLQLSLASVVREVGNLSCSELRSSSCDVHAFVSLRIASVLKKLHAEHASFLSRFQICIAKGLRGHVLSNKKRLQALDATTAV